MVTILGSQDSTNLPKKSVDLVFLSDVYHHLEKPEKALASIHQALRPGGRLVVIEFDRVEGKSSAFVLKHVCASQAVFRKEIEAAGFVGVPTPQPPQLKENFFLASRRSAGATAHDAGQDALVPLRIGSGRSVRSMLLTDRVPDFDECLGFGVAPGEPGFFQLVGAATPLLAPVDRPAGHDAAICQRVEDRRRSVWAAATPEGVEGRRGSRRFRRGDDRRHDFERAGRFLVSQQQREPSLDTPNMRPASASLQGPKIAHGIIPNVLPGGSPSKIHSFQAAYPL